MGKDKITEELLRDAFLKLSDELIEEWENIPDIEHKPSKEFNEKMDKLLKKSKKKESLRVFLDVGRIAAAIFIVICGILFVNTMEARANPYIWFKKMEVILNDSSMYVYDEESERYYLNLYEPTYVPEGYEEVERNVEELGISIVYRNEQNNRITWKQRLISDSTIAGTDTEYDGKIETEYQGEDITVYVYEDGYKYLYYESEKCVFSLSTNNISYEDMHKMIESMEIVNE